MADPKITGGIYIPKWDWGNAVGSGKVDPKAQQEYEEKLAKYNLAKETMLKNGYTIDSNNGGYITFSQVAKRTTDASGKTVETIVPRGNNTLSPAKTSYAKGVQNDVGIFDKVLNNSQNIANNGNNFIANSSEVTGTSGTSVPASTAANTSGYIYNPTTSWAEELAKYDKSVAKTVANSDWSVPTTMADAVSKYSNSGTSSGIASMQYVTDVRDSGVIPQQKIDYLY